MEWCEKAGIPHSQFLGGPAVWTPLDRAKALAYATWKRGNCRDCGTRPEHWDPALGGDRFAMIADTFRCVGCEVLAQERANVPDDAKGVHVYLRPNPNAPGGSGE